MRTTPLIAALGIIAAGLTLQAPAPAAVEDHPAARSGRTTLVSTEESGCFEVPITRAVTLAKVNPPLPSRYVALPLADPANTSVSIVTNTCEDFRVNRLGNPVDLPDQADQAAEPDVDPGRPTITTIGAVRLRSRAGVPTSGSYLLWYGTNNKVLFDKLDRIGLPVFFMPESTSTADEATHQILWKIRGQQDYDVPVTVPADRGAQTPANDLVLYYDTADGRSLRWTYTDQLMEVRNGTATIPPLATAANRIDVSRLELAGWLALPTLKTIPATNLTTSVGVQFIRGSWNSHVEVLDD
jgi:hypothetical protein